MKALALALIAGLLSAGCAKDEVESWLSSPTAQGREDLFLEGPSSKMLQAFEKRLGKDVRALSLVVYQDHAVLQAVSAQNEKAVDQYVYRNGRLSDPVPVKLMGKGKVADNAFALRDVALPEIPAVVTAARRQVDIPEGVVSRVIVKRNLPKSVDVRFRVHVTSQRRDGFAEADSKARLLDGAHRGDSNP